MIEAMPSAEIYEEGPDPIWPAPNPAKRVFPPDEPVDEIRMDEEEGYEEDREVIRPQRTTIPEPEPAKRRFFPRRSNNAISVELSTVTDDNDALVGINSLASVIEMRKLRPIRPMLPPHELPPIYDQGSIAA